MDSRNILCKPVVKLSSGILLRETGKKRKTFFSSPFPQGNFNLIIRLTIPSSSHYSSNTQDPTLLKLYPLNPNSSKFTITQEHSMISLEKITWTLPSFHIYFPNSHKEFRNIQEAQHPSEHQPSLL